MEYMNQQKGFSLVEVLTSLLLVTTFTLFLAQQQLQSRQLLIQLILYQQASVFLDQMSEQLLARVKSTPGPAPYHVKVTNQPQSTLLQLQHNKQNGELTRTIGVIL